MYIVLFAKPDCSYCQILSKEIPDLIKELSLDIKLFYINIDTIEDAEIVNALARRGVPYIEFKDDKLGLLSSLVGRPTLDHKLLKEEGIDLSNLNELEQSSLEIYTIRMMFANELYNALSKTNANEKDLILVLDLYKEYKQNVYNLLDIARNKWSE